MKKCFFILLNSIFNGSNHAKCVSLSNQKCMIQMYDSIDVLEVLILLMANIIKCMFQIKQKI